MDISKTTANYAEKRDVNISIFQEVLYITTKYSEENDCASVSYTVSDDEVLAFNELFEKHIEDLPAHITSEKQLREVINFVAKETNH